ncbi:MAG: DNA polymerase III [Treponema sp.]|nr:DNA polymerase III [Treponema sp.]
MFENIVQQEITKNLISDIKKNNLPGAILYSGPEASGKLSAALETARILSCHNKPQGHWLCKCPSCLRHKALSCSDLILMGPRDCSLEISAAKDTFLRAYKNNDSFLDATRYLFLRSIRKLTLRFNPIIWQGEKDLSKIGNIIEQINEDLEILDFPRPLPDINNLESICEDLVKQSLKLENDFLYDSIPVNQIRNMEVWAHIKSEEGKKTVIIENADRMAAAVRNALLKILEEPPLDCQFILLSSNRNAIMQTILSRVRTYTFSSRKLEQQVEVIKRIFHKDSFEGQINDFLLSYLAVSPEVIKEEAKLFYDSICNRKIPDIDNIVKKCEDFYPRIVLKIFIQNLTKLQKPLLYSQNGSEASAQCMKLFRDFWDNITLYNQKPQAALEILLRDMSHINVIREGVFQIG